MQQQGPVGDRFCPACMKLLVRRRDERLSNFLKRTFCDRECSMKVSVPRWKGSFNRKK